MSDTFFYAKIKQKAHIFIMDAYDSTDTFPSVEKYGSAQQLRRAAVSIMLNFLEGFGRVKPKVKLNFFEISYGSIRECKYLIYLAVQRKWISKEQYDKMFGMVDEVGAMMWSIIVGIEKQINESE